MLHNIKGPRQEVLAAKFADNLKICSCDFACANARYNPWSSQKAKRTIQEHRNLYDFIEQILEWEIMEENYEQEVVLSQNLHHSYKKGLKSLF